MAQYNGEVLVRRIRHLCKERGISVAKMEKDLSWSPGLISRWTKTSPSIGKVMEVVKYLDVRYEELLESDDEEDVGEDLEESLSHKLFVVTKAEKLEWIQCDDNFDNDDVQILLNSGGISKRKIYYTSFEEGYFLLIIEREEIELKLGILYSLKGEIVYDIDDNKEWLEALLRIVDSDEFKNWNELKTKSYISRFLRTDF